MNVFRAALARDFWITGIAIAPYIPRAFRVKQVDGDQFSRTSRGESIADAWKASLGDVLFEVDASDVFFFILLSGAMEVVQPDIDGERSVA
jgi:hypothetical protein